jgi:sugar (pentulose or hexulose) kinase
VPPATVLTLDLGTSATKAALWHGTELRALARATLATSHPHPGYAEQEPASWWQSVIEACAQVRGDAGVALDSIEAVSFSAARETFALYDDDLGALTPGILWSDRRADEDADRLGDPATFRATTGVVLNAGTHAAKLAWVARGLPDAMARARWVLAPRDVVVARMTGAVVTDETLASRTGLYALTGDWLGDARARYGELLPRVVSSDTVVGELTPDAARDLGLPRGARVVAGAGDRACEVLGTAASPSVPMVSWGTTANVSVPHAGPAGALPADAAVSRGALGGFVVEAGLSAAGAAIAWLSSLTGRTHDDLLTAAAGVPPGARGVVALPWLAGARAPWWRPDAHAAFIGLTDAHGPAELTRAVVEGVALDTARCLELIAPASQELVIAGGGAGDNLWRLVLASVTGCRVTRRAVDDGASVGARLLAAAALDETLDVDDLNPVVAREDADSSLVAAYRPVRAASDAAAGALLGAFRAPVSKFIDR